MTHDTPTSANEHGPAARCIVCMKTIRQDEVRWTVHFRGSEHTVCCPSCVQQFNRSPAQFLERP